MRNFSLDNRSSGRNLNAEPPKSKGIVLSTRGRCLADQRYILIVISLQCHESYCDVSVFRRGFG
jgi:hypothetical protein